MRDTVTIDQIELLLKNEYGDPHSVLGLHIVSKDGGSFAVVRELIPGAVSINVKDNASGKKYTMEKVHDEGFFSAVIDDRKEYFNYTLIVDFGGGNVWVTPDQYTFEPTITDYDMYLFAQGTNYRIYEKLGAHEQTIDSVEGVSFAVWAPNAKSVSVIGDFNMWDPRRSQMRLLNNSGIWEIFIPQVKAGDKYKFKIKDAKSNSVDKSDPYGVEMELRPGTASVVYNIHNYKWNDEEWIRYRSEHERYDRPVNIYEVHMGSWRRVGNEDRFMTYREAAEMLVKYVKEMGYTHIEFMPLAEHPFDGSWGYQVIGYYAPTSRYGSPKDFMYLVDTCHQNGIGVIMDWVPAHFPKDLSGLARFDGTALYEHEDSRLGEHRQWGTYIFNYGRNEVKNFLIANALYWLREYHIDGLRVDAVASMLYLDYGRNEGDWIANRYGGRENLDAVEFLKHLNSIVRKTFPGVMMMAEESTSWEGVTRDTKYNGLGFTFKWDMGWMNDFLNYIKKETVYRKYHHNYLTFSMMYNYNENFILVLSHDEVVHMKGAMIYKVPGDLWQKAANLRVSYGFMYGHPGKKLLFMGNEIGQFSEWSEARSLDWHLLQYDTHRNLKDYVMDLNHFYLKHPAMWKKDFDPAGFEWIDCDDASRSIVSFERRCDAERLTIVCNFTETTYDTFKLGVYELGVYKEVFNSDNLRYGGTGRLNQGEYNAENFQCSKAPYSINITLPPLGFVIFKKENN